jgi:hypothetical protein
MATPVQRFLLSGHMLFSGRAFCSLHGGCFQYVYTPLVIYSIIGLPLVHSIFRRSPDPASSFYIHNYLFEFAHTGSNDDIAWYNVSLDDFRMRFVIYGIDNSGNCNTYSNLDFVTFIWQNFERFDFLKYALTHVRRNYLSLPEFIMSKIL